MRVNDVLFTSELRGLSRRLLEIAWPRHVRSETEAAFRRVLVEDMLLFDYARRVGADRERYSAAKPSAASANCVAFVRRTRIQAHIESRPKKWRNYERNLRNIQRRAWCRCG
jgi:hypothetical protein